MRAILPGQSLVFHNHLADWRRPRNATTQAGRVRAVSLVQSQGSK